MFCIHHDDMDGKSAAAIVASYYNDYNPNHYYEMNYEMAWPVEQIKRNETVVIVDFSLQESNYNEFKKIREKAANIIWIDHHKTSIEITQMHPELNHVNGIRLEGISGCALAYLYFYCEREYNIKNCPLWIQLISDHDCWQKKLKDSDSFKMGVDAIEDDSPTADLWRMLIRSKSTESYELTKKIIEIGNLVGSYERKQNKYQRRRAYETTINGYRAIVVNGIGNSFVFGDLIDKYDVCCLWRYDGSTHKFKYSLYSNTIDTTIISKQYNGGGHKGASGFNTSEAPEWLFPKE